MSIVSGSLGAVFSAQEQRRATRTNADIARRAQELQEKLFHESRGSTGHAILPEYFGDEERRLGEYAGDISRASREVWGTPMEAAARGKRLADRYRPLLEEGTKAIEGIYSGDLERERLANLAPLAETRLSAAKSRRQSISQALADHRARLAAINAEKGYSGTGSASEQLALRTSLGAGQEAADVETAARLQTAEDERAIKDYITELQLKSPEVATALMREAMALDMTPAEYLRLAASSAYVPYDFFRVPVGQQPPIIPPPYQQPNVGVGQILSAAGQQAGQAALNWYLNSLGSGGGGGGAGGGGHV